jgi:hypothetical protein
MYGSLRSVYRSAAEKQKKNKVTVLLQRKRREKGLNGGGLTSSFPSAAPFSYNDDRHNAPPLPIPAINISRGCLIIAEGDRQVHAVKLDGAQVIIVGMLLPPLICNWAEYHGQIRC